MRVVRNVLLLLFIFTSFWAYADKNKKAQKAMEKGELAKAALTLQEILKDDSLDAVANYLYSVLFTVDSFPAYSIDSAQRFILAAQSSWPIITPKEQAKGAKDGFGPTLFDAHKLKIDSLGYRRALRAGDVPAFETFARQFADAAMVEEALEKRDSVAYHSALTEDSWQAYKYFFDTYPNARQVPDAQEKYNSLVFKDLTQDRKLASFEEFLRKFPNTPFRKEAEKQIFDIMTATNDPVDYLRFIRTYPLSHVRKKAFDFLYAVDQGAHNFSFYPQYTPVRALQDSLDRLRHLEEIYLVPVYENGKYGFMDPSGEVVMTSKFAWIAPQYYCGDIMDDFLVVGQGKDLELVNRAGDIIAEDEFEVYEGIGLGLIKAGAGGKVGLWHKSGYPILNQQYDDIRLIANRLLLIVQEGKAGLATYSGKVLITPQYDDIAVEGNFWVFVKEERLAYTSFERIIAIANQEKLDLKFEYEELERLPDGFMIGYSGDMECLVNTKHEVLIPMAPQKIYSMGDNWLVKQPFGYRIFYADTKRMSDGLYQRVEYNVNWLAWKTDKGWSLANKKSVRGIIFELDSAHLINQDVAISFEELKGTVHFAGGAAVDFVKGDKVYLLTENFEKAVYKAEEQFLVVENSRSKRVFSMAGNLLFDLRQGNLRYLSPTHLVLEIKGKWGIVDSSGVQKLAPKYDGIGQADLEGFVTVLQEGKFGSFHMASGRLVPPKYDTRVRFFNQKLLVATSKSKEGLVDYTGKTVLPLEYDKVLPWTDSLVMARKNGMWAISTPDGKNSLFTPFINYQVERSDKEETVLKIYTNEGYGILSNKRGIVLKPTYNDLINLGSDVHPLYFAEKHVKEAEFFVVIYADANGAPFKSQAFRAGEYDKIFCQ